MSQTGPMHKHLIRYILILLFALIILPAHAQKNGYSRGYIINFEGETIEGQVKDRSSGTFFELYKRIRFKPDNASFKRKYSPDEILGYGINDQHFESVPLFEETAFFKFRYYIDENYDRVFLKVISWGKIPSEAGKISANFSKPTKPYRTILFSFSGLIYSIP